jgi:hypothetical protein
MRNRLLAAFAVLALLALVPAALAAQAGGQGIMFGTWTLSVAKSSFGGGPKLMAMTVKVTSDKPELIQFSVSQTMESGIQISYSYKGAADDKPYPIIGSSSVYSYTEEPGIVHETQKDADGTITRGDFTVSNSGRTGTWDYTITNPDGTQFKQKLVFTHSA